MKTVSFGKYTAPNVDPVTTDLDGWTPIEGRLTFKHMHHFVSIVGYFIGAGSGLPITGEELAICRDML